MTIVIGTAGHIDHGKTTLLRALTGIDADRLPEERRRGMTIDVGYAHLDVDGSTIDFVDVPGHDKLVGNMLVGAGEIDAAMLIVAADDGPRAQTVEHLALLDALGITNGLVVVTKVDAVSHERVEAVRMQVHELISSTSLAGAPILAASSLTGRGVDGVRAAVSALPDRVALVARPPTLAIDRVFTVKGRGVVVTGTLRGGPLARGENLRLVPGRERSVRIREIQVHGTTVDRVERGGRTALNLAGVAADPLRRGMVLTADPRVVATDRVLAAFRSTIPDRAPGRVHAGTAAVDAAISRSGRDALTLPDGRAAGIVRMAEPMALRGGDAFVFRRGAPALPVGAVVLDPDPPRGISRRRQTEVTVAALATGRPSARLELHGFIDGELSPDVRAAAEEVALETVGDEASLTAIRAAVALALRRAVTIRRERSLSAASTVLERLVADGRLVRDGDLVRRPDAAPPRRDPRADEAMDRLVAALDTPTPPALGETARSVGCSPEAIRELERTGRIVILGDDLAYATSTYDELTTSALDLAARGPLTPAAFRDATGTSRKYVMAILGDLDRRAILLRTPDGHVPGPKAPTVVAR